MNLDGLVREKAVIVCCGSGGVGKTTTAAAIGLAAAKAGRRACVVTIDPAKRLADALGIGEITDLPRRVEGPWAAPLDAVMLDPASTFDRLVERYARDREQVAKIFENRIYKNLVATLSGTQEYMATERLYELADGDAYDLIVVDTPPSRDALAFLAAPERLSAFLDNRLFRLLIAPGRASLRAFGAAADVLLRTIGRVAGREIVEDTIAFFRAFDGMEEGFRERASAVNTLLGDERTGYVLVTTPRRESLEETGFLATRLRESKHPVDALVVNRVHPDFGPPIDGSAGAGDWGALVENLAKLARLRAEEQEALRFVDPERLVGLRVDVPLLADDVHDLDSLERLSRLLVNDQLP